MVGTCTLRVMARGTGGCGVDAAWEIADGVVNGRASSTVRDGGGYRWGWSCSERSTSCYLLSNDGPGRRARRRRRSESRTG